MPPDELRLQPSSSRNSHSPNRPDSAKDPSTPPQESTQHRAQRIKREPQPYSWHLKYTDIKTNFKDDEIAKLKEDKDTIEQMASLLKQELQREQPNIQVIRRYKDKFAEYSQLQQQLEQILGVIREMKEQYDSLRKKRYDEFMAGFKQISTQLKTMYQLITNGGDAELELVDMLDPFAEGVIFTVRPNQKSWKQMNKLSGGEKTLSSLALIFALHYYKPSPLYCMDEIDAALDYKNVAIVGNYIKKRARNTQFIIISLRNNMFELADKLVGIYKTFDVTKTITMNPNLMKKKIEEAEQANKENEGPVQVVE